MSSLRLLPVLAVLFWLSGGVQAQQEQPVPAAAVIAPDSLMGASKIQALIRLHSADELRTLLQRAEEISVSPDFSLAEPVAIVLHGDEVRLFERRVYREHKELVDLAARLHAFNIVDLKVCQRYMASQSLQSNDLPPFLQAVPDGAAEVQRLQLQGYASF